MNYNALSEEQVLEGLKKYGPAAGSRKMIDWEYDHAMEAINSKCYVTYWCESKKSECGRIGSNSKCFCGHHYKNHNQNAFGKKIQINCQECLCKQFRFVPSRPEECGMWWLPRRKEFDVTKWRAPCKCRHTHEEHSCNRPQKCSKCSCFDFASDFACISCDCCWEDHIVLFETEDERRILKKTVGEAFLPLSDKKEMQDIVFTSKPAITNDSPYTWKRPAATTKPAKPQFTIHDEKDPQFNALPDSKPLAVFGGAASMQSAALHRPQGSSAIGSRSHGTAPGGLKPATKSVKTDYSKKPVNKKY